MTLPACILAIFNLFNIVIIQDTPNQIDCINLDNSLKNTVCSICRQNIKIGEGYYTNFWGDIFHTNHVDDLNQCYSCNRLISPGNCSNSPHKSGGYQYQDGRYICNHCVKTGELVFFESEGEEILQDLLTRGKEIGVDIPNIFKLNLVSEKELSTIRNAVLRKGEKNPALTSLQISKKILSGGILNIDTKCEIYVLKGLHQTYFEECLAHELMHVWLFVNALYELQPQFCEGLCNYFAFEMLQHDYTDDYAKFYLKAMEKSPDLIYGEGFRKVRQLAKELASWENLLVFAKYNNQLPNR